MKDLAVAAEQEIAKYKLGPIARVIVHAGTNDMGLHMEGVRSSREFGQIMRGMMREVRKHIGDNRV